MEVSASATSLPFGVKVQRLQVEIQVEVQQGPPPGLEMNVRSW